MMQHNELVVEKSALDEQQNHIKELEKENKLLREGLELILSDDHFPNSSYYGEAYTSHARSVLKQIDKSKK